MRKNGIVKRLLIFSLITVMVLTMQGMPVFAGAESPESQSKTQDGQPDAQSEIPAKQSVSQNELSALQSVSQNGLSESQSVSQNGLFALQVDNQLDAGSTTAASVSLSPDILQKCIVPAQNPQGVTVNLFDYWQNNGSDPTQEEQHDYKKSDGTVVTTYNLGISKGHLLRFGYRDNSDSDLCNTEEGFYGAWNQYYQDYDVAGITNYDSNRDGEIYTGIVQNRLGTDGFPKLNFKELSSSAFGQYNTGENNAKYLTDANKEESLAYLFSTNVSNNYKESHSNVLGLFQRDSDGYYYYNSTKNFAWYNPNTNSFVLYNSPGVAQLKDTEAVFCGQFFPFNKAMDVFDTYNTDPNGNYRLLYMDIAQKGDPTNSEESIDGYRRCYAPVLNHYLGMTLEMLFMQPENGLVNGKPMTFEFSGDDDVWIFIDDVLVADLGGIHDAYSLKIDFSSGDIYIQRLNAALTKDHELLTSFKKVYGDDSNPGGIAFRGNTFADNTVHTLKMFYLERGYMASNLSLNFNIQPVRYDLNTEADTETDETEPYSEEEHTDETITSDILPAVDVNTTVVDNVGIPQTGDDSMIWWWAALCAISFLGIVAVACNLIFVRKKQKNITTEGKSKKHSSRK